MDVTVVSWVADAAVFAGIIVAAVVVFLVTFRLLFRFVWRTRAAAELQHRCRWPGRVSVALVAANAGLGLLPLTPSQAAVARHVLLIALIIALAWLAIQAVYVVEDAFAGRFDITVRDNLLARRRRTQSTVLRRIVVVFIGLTAAAAALMTFENARAFGTSVLASAGVAGIVAGIAGRSILENLIAGIQIAFSEPFRLDDVVVVEGEWGRIEEITLTYVVVRLWDFRRLVLPTSYFIETPFQNWTRTNAQVLGAVELQVDFRTPVDQVRAEFGRIVERNDKWDGETSVLQVTDARERTMILRGLVTAEDAATAWELRCEVREALIGFLRDRYPWALPTTRVEVGTTAEPDPNAAPAATRASERSGSVVERSVHGRERG